MSIFYMLTVYFNWVSADLRIAFVAAILMSAALVLLGVMMIVVPLLTFKIHGFVSAAIKTFSLGGEVISYCFLLLSACCLFARLIYMAI